MYLKLTKTVDMLFLNLVIKFEYIKEKKYLYPIYDLSYNTKGMILLPSFSSSFTVGFKMSYYSNIEIINMLLFIHEHYSINHCYFIFITSHSR